jgi:CheY-like chemotaxis protein/DNA-binding XRE family transcriptional regulator
MSLRWSCEKLMKKEFGAEIRRRRIQLGISQEELAERADLHRTYVTDAERGARNLSLESIRRLAAALGASVGSLFSSIENPPSANGYGRGKSPDKRTVDILLVEDDPRDVEMTLAAFKEAGVNNRVQVVRDGAEALDFLFCRGIYAQRKMANRPQVVLLDLNLPKVHGMDVLRQIKADKRTKQIRVVVLTVSRTDDFIREALRLGAEAYIVKPVDFQRFSKITPQLDFSWTLLQSSMRSAA